jgi:hypothetical protein
MNVWALGTWASVLVMVVGSAAVFAWFLRDARLVFRDMNAAHEEYAGERSAERHTEG